MRRHRHRAALRRRVAHDQGTVRDPRPRPHGSEPRAGIVSSPYLYLLGGCSAAALLLYQAALQACRASILIPVSNVVSSVYFVIAGTWLFHEHLPASPVKLVLRLAGIAAAGLVLIALSRNRRSPSGVLDAD